MTHKEDPISPVSLWGDMRIWRLRIEAMLKLKCQTERSHLLSKVITTLKLVADHVFHEEHDARTRLRHLNQRVHSNPGKVMEAQKNLVRLQSYHKRIAALIDQVHVLQNLELVEEHYNHKLASMRCCPHATAKIRELLKRNEGKHDKAHQTIVGLESEILNEIDHLHLRHGTLQRWVSGIEA